MSKRTSRCPAIFCRIHHFRGHSIHSPFAYSLVRDILMKPPTAHYTGPLHDLLLREGVPAKYAFQIDSLIKYYDLDGFAVNNTDRSNVDKSSILLTATPSCNAEELLLLERSAMPSDIFCVCMPRKSRTRRNVCRKLIERHGGLSIENKVTLLLFYDSGLNKQHIRL